MKGSFLQNMAPNAKRSFVVSIVFAAVAIVIYMFAVEPASSSLAKEQKRLQELKDNQEHMNRDLGGADSIKKKLAELEEGFKPFNEAMLTPLLESYSMRAKSILDPLMLGAGLTDIEYMPDTFRALPLTKPMSRQLHTRAAILITARGSYQATTSFLLRLEKEFPLVSLQSLEITAQQSTTKQEIRFVLEWPAKGGLTRK